MGDQDVPDPGVQKQDTQTMFSDDKGFEQYSSPDYGSGTRAEKAGFMSADTSDVTDETKKKEKEERILAQKKLHKFSGYPIGIGDKYF